MQKTFLIQLFLNQLSVITIKSAMKRICLVTQLPEDNRLARPQNRSLLDLIERVFEMTDQRVERLFNA